jgi:hypothetical protein
MMPTTAPAATILVGGFSVPRRAAPGIFIATNGIT